MATKKPKTDALVEQVEELHTKPKFNAAKWIADGGVQLPETELDVFTDVRSAYQITLVDREIEALLEAHTPDPNDAGSITDEGPDELILPLRQKRQKLAEGMWESRLIFKLKGLSPKVSNMLDREAIEKFELNSYDQQEWLAVQRLTFMLEGITEASSGEVDEGPWSFDDTKNIFTGLPDSEQSKLIEEVAFLAVGVKLSDQRGDADFLS